MPLTRARWVDALIFGTLLACGGGGGDGGGITPPPPPPPPPPSPSPSASVTLRAATFDPTSVTITRTGTVTWNNTSGVVHNVTFTAATGAPANIGDHSSGSNQRTFDTVGNFAYSCTNHAGMNGSVSVQ